MPFEKPNFLFFCFDLLSLGFVWLRPTTTVVALAGPGCATFHPRWAPLCWFLLLLPGTPITLFFGFFFCWISLLLEILGFESSLLELPLTCAFIALYYPTFHHRWDPLWSFFPIAARDVCAPSFGFFFPFGSEWDQLFCTWILHLHIRPCLCIASTRFSIRLVLGGVHFRCLLLRSAPKHWALGQVLTSIFFSSSPIGLLLVSTMSPLPALSIYTATALFRNWWAPLFLHFCSQSAVKRPAACFLDWICCYSPLLSSPLHSSS